MLIFAVSSTTVVCHSTVAPRGSSSVQMASSSGLVMANVLTWDMPVASTTTKFSTSVAAVSCAWYSASSWSCCTPFTSGLLASMVLPSPYSVSAALSCTPPALMLSTRIPTSTARSCVLAMTT